MIATIEAPNQATLTAVLSRAMALGVEYLPLTGLQVELTSADDMRVLNTIKKYKVKVLHVEHVKTIAINEL